MASGGGGRRMVIGTHMSVADGIARTAENVVWMEANTMQIFSRNPRGSGYRTYSDEEINKFQKIRKENGFGPFWLMRLTP